MLQVLRNGTEIPRGEILAHVQECTEYIMNYVEEL